MAARIQQTPPPAKSEEVDALAQLAFLTFATLERHVAEHELSMIQTRLLGVLRDRTPSMNELAAMLDLDKSSVSGLVARAERRGLVTRAAATQDARSVLVELTAAGRRVVATVAGRFERDVSAMLSGLPADDRAALQRCADWLVAQHAPGRGFDLPRTGHKKRRR